MKNTGHPAYKDLEVTCSCGNVFVTKSTITKDKTSIEVCSQCHPFYTGKQKVIDSGGRVLKFKNKFANVLKKS